MRMPFGGLPLGHVPKVRPCRRGWLCSSPALPPAESAGVRSVVKLEILAALDKLGDDLPPTMLGVGVPVIFGDMEKGLGELASSLRACPA
jgi:hypothetical protein